MPAVPDCCHFTQAQPKAAAKKAHTGRVTELDRPSRPSVMFTAFTVPVMTSTAKMR